MAADPLPRADELCVGPSPSPGQTASALFIETVQAEDDGLYSVILIDAVGTVHSQAARLTVLIPPSILIQPLSQSIIEGGSVTFSVQTEGTLPMGYRWRRDRATFLNVVLNSDVSFLTLTNVQLEDAGVYTVVATNQAFFQPGVLSVGAILTVLSDSDGDGMDDDWETENGLNPNDPNDANDNADGDILSNREEYDAGTDPNDASSFLQITSLVMEPEHPVRISFLAVSNKTYSVQFTDSLTLGSWSRLEDVPAASTNRVVELEDPVLPLPPERYYRLVTPRQ